MTFPGPPKYESIADGDLEETGWYLNLHEPITVDVLPGNEALGNDEREEHIDQGRLLSVFVSSGDFYITVRFYR